MKIVNFNQMLVALTCACLGASSFAQNPIDGFYIGASFGGTSTNVNQDQIILATFNDSGGDFDSTGTILIDGPNHLKPNNSFKGALYAGFGESWNRYYLGGEIFVDLARYRNWNKLEEETTIGVNPGPGTYYVEGITHTKLSNIQYGIDLRPGILLTPDSMFYGRVGVAFANLGLHTKAIFAGDDNGDGGIWDLVFDLVDSEQKAVLRLGAGLETKLWEHINCRLDYIYTYYGKEGVGGGPVASGLFPHTIVVVPATFAVGSDTSVKTYNNTVMVGLSYLFKNQKVK